MKAVHDLLHGLFGWWDESRSGGWGNSGSDGSGILLFATLFQLGNVLKFFLVALEESVGVGGDDLGDFRVFNKVLEDPKGEEDPAVASVLGEDPGVSRPARSGTGGREEAIDGKGETSGAKTGDDTGGIGLLHDAVEGTSPNTIGISELSGIIELVVLGGRHWEETVLG